MFVGNGDAGVVVWGCEPPVKSVMASSNINVGVVGLVCWC